MKNQEIKSKVETIIQKINDQDNQYWYYGLRFEDKERKVGSICNVSRHNPNRSDERDFPVWGKSSYYRLPKLQGTSAWYIDLDGYNTDWIKSFWYYYGTGLQDIGSTEITSGHCYIIAGNNNVTHDDCDNSEIVIEDAIVIEQIF